MISFHIKKLKEYIRIIKINIILFLERSIIFYCILRIFVVLSGFIYVSTFTVAQYVKALEGLAAKGERSDYSSVM